MFNAQSVSQKAAGTFVFYNHIALHYPPVTGHYLLPSIEAINRVNLNFIQPLPAQKLYIFAVEIPSVTLVLMKK
jgi:hypothetical protein